MISAPFNVSAMGRELSQREKELCQNISTETNSQRFLALVAELNDLLQAQREQEPRLETRSDAISGSRSSEGR